jgi:gliding motility-associated-like protein
VVGIYQIVKTVYLYLVHIEFPTYQIKVTPPQLAKFKYSFVNKSIRLFRIYLCFQLFISGLNVVLAQCDTLPTALRWDFAGYDSTYLDFSQSIVDGSVAEFVGAVDFSPRGSECSAVIANPDGSSSIYFNGVGIFDGSTLLPLANDEWLGDEPSRPVFTSNSSYFQPLIVPKPSDPELYYLFYGMPFRSDFLGQQNDLDMPAWVALYDKANDSLVFRDSVVHRRATESWTAMRHPDEHSWWIATRQHSPSGVLVYKLSVNGLETAIFSPGGPQNGGINGEDASGISFSPDGTKIIVGKYTSSLNPNVLPNDGQIWLFDFDCAEGSCTNPELVFSGGSATGLGLSFTPGNKYIYSPASLLGSFGDSLFRWDVGRYDGSIGPKQAIPNGGRARLGVTRGPDGRIYTGPSNGYRPPALPFESRIGYVDKPDRWLALDPIDSTIRNGGALYENLSSETEARTGLNMPSIPVTLPELRTPRLRGDNIVQCGDTLNYRLVENCYQELALVTTTPGPGVEMARTGSELLLSFDTASTLPQVRYLAMANDHACRTYRDTFWIYVEGCENNCTSVFSNEALTACDSALVHSEWRYTSGDLTQTFQNLHGCDSSSTVALTIENSIQNVTAVSGCDSVLVHGSWVSTSGEYAQTFSGINGCDSTSTVTANINSQLATSEQLNACDSAFVAGQWQFASGDYPETFQSVQGCDSTHTVQLSLGLSVSTADVINACDSSFIHQEWINASGTYPQTFSSAQGCDSTSTIELVITPTPPLVLLPTDTTLSSQEGFSLNLDSLAAFVFDWQPPTAVDCVDCPLVDVLTSFAGRLSVEIGEAPCSQTASLLINRENKEASTFATPNAFSPNGDGNNDVFEIALPPDTELLEFAIYDRWGSMVYLDACPCTPNANGLIETWDGNYQGKPANPAVYAWVARLRDGSGIERLEKGDMTLVR